ncbi:MAG: alpha/beta hydrolase [Rubrivivax sp.]|nr:MAG: alpha/beta hydrolase [Rubrivivax sp.]
MSPAEFQALPSQPADHRIAYGDDTNQFGDLRLPASPGPRPVVVLVHGGCWKEPYATLRDMAPLADALKAAGIASWNIEYRRIPQPGSGWPGTFQDVGRAVDHLRALASTHRLDLDRVIVMGHSAGGHLALWAAARHRLPPHSPLHAPNALRVKGVVDLAGVGDLQAFMPAQAEGCRDASVVETLLGGAPSAVPERYVQASATRLLPLGTPQILVWGEQDEMTPLRFGHAHVDAARRAGDDARLIAVPSLGHFEIADPASPAWSVVLQAVRSLLETRP